VTFETFFRPICIWLAGVDRQSRTGLIFLLLTLLYYALTESFCYLSRLVFVVSILEMSVVVDECNLRLCWLSVCTVSVRHCVLLPRRCVCLITLLYPLRAATVTRFAV